MNLLIWLVLGLLAGAIANLIDPRPARGGLMSAILLGISGALIGGFLGSLFFGVGVTGFNLSSLVIATAGALLLLLVGRALSRR